MKTTIGRGIVVVVDRAKKHPEGWNLERRVETQTFTKMLVPLQAPVGECSDSPDGGMDVYDVLRQDRFHRPAANPIVFAAPLLCDAQWRFVWPMLRTG